MAAIAQAAATGTARGLECQCDIKEQMGEILGPYEGQTDELIPILQKVQERFGYLPEEAMAEIAAFLHMPQSTVFGVATFYAQFKLTPTGKHTVKVCRGTACHVRGATRLLDEVQNLLSVEVGGTTADGNYTLESIACFGSCALAPVMVLDETVHGRTTVSKARRMLSVAAEEDSEG